MAQRILRGEQRSRPLLSLAFETLVHFSQLRLRGAELARSLVHLVLKTLVQFAQLRLARGQR